MFRKLIVSGFAKIAQLVIRKKTDSYQFSDIVKKRNLVSFDGYMGYTGIGKMQKDGKDAYMFYIAIPQREKKDAVDMLNKMTPKLRELFAFHKQLKFSSKNVYAFIEKLGKLMRNV